MAFYLQYRFVHVGGDDFEVDPEGCTHHMSRMEIEKHEAKCEFAIVDCRHSIRCGRMRRGMMAKHEEEECPYRPVSCEHCGFETESRNLATHLTECTNLPLECSHCRKSVLQGQMKRHLERECEGKRHSCPFAPQGCKAQELTPSELKAHLREDAADHLELMQMDHALSLKLLENRFLKQIAIKDAEIEELKRANRNRYRFMWNVEWKHTPGNTTNVRAYTSEKFVIFGRTFYLALWPIGEPQDTDSAIAVPEDPYWSSNLPDNITIQPPQGESPNPSRRSSISATTTDTSSLLSPSLDSSPPITIGANYSQRSPQVSSSVGSTTSQSPMSAPPIGASPKSLSQRIFEGFRSFTRQRSRDVLSTSPPASSNNSSGFAPSTAQARSSSQSEQPNGELVATAQTGPTTWVAIYLMMEPDSVAPASSTAPPQIFSPVSGLVRASAISEWGNAEFLSHPHSSGLSSPPHWLNTRQSAYAAYPELNRNMNVSLARPGESQPVRAPESMVLEYTLRLVNNSPLLTKSVYFETTFPVPNGNGWGEERFIETSQISRSSGFLSHKNMLLVQCDIQVRQCTFEV